MVSVKIMSPLQLLTRISFQQ